MCTSTQNPLCAIDLSKVSFGERFLTREGKKAVLIGKHHTKDIYFVAIEGFGSDRPYSTCRDGFHRWSLHGKSQLRMATEAKDKGAFDLVCSGWDEQTARALQKKYTDDFYAEHIKNL